ncbi:FkbM family methyltransferase [Sphingobium lactosutens]|uniref:FkbM family methyltransferase n=1 Tax=Sphingobium lactosutens TaxID=522773 RepID=UPI0015BFB2C7|nr:FkbM family methyltransferase [Sphingobium lactosutens]
MLPAYEAMVEDVYSSLLISGDVAIDVGSHNGRHSIPMAEKVGKDGRIYCFEPLPAQFANFQNLVDERNLQQISVFNIALGTEDGKATFTSVPDFPEFSGFKERQYHDHHVRVESIEVEVRSIDSFFSDINKVKFIKIDTEGGELTVLRGASGLISRSRPFISFELGDSSLINYEYTSNDYFSYFEDMGYKIFSIFGIELDRSQFVQFSAEQFFWDYVAIPREKAWPAAHGPIRTLVAQMSGL